jgi:O-antigen/teichoic acid export membrane protein
VPRAAADAILRVRLNVIKTIWYGSAWAVAMRWSMRLVGMLSVVILARLLKPEDFGILAMASLLIGAFASFTGVGVGALLIREANISQVDMDTAWTIRIIQGMLLAAVVALLAYPASLYFREPRLTEVVYVCALGLFLGSFANIGIVLIRKELDFAKDFRYHLIIKFVGVATTISLAFWLRSYWALAIARPVAAVIDVAISYLMHPYRPRFSMKSAHRFYRFSAFVITSNVARFINSKADVFLVGTVGTASEMGTYNVAAEMSAIPPKEITVSVGRAMFPTLSRLKHAGGDVGDLQASFLAIVGSVAVLCIPMGLGLWIVADDFVHVVLGERWAATTALIGYLAIYGTLESLINIMLGHIMIVTGHEHRQSAAWWIRCVLLVAGALIGMQFGIQGIAIGATISGAIMFVISIGILMTTLPFKVSDFIRIYWRPTLAALAMTLVVHYSAQALHVPTAARLVLCVAIGALSYVVALGLLWLASGRPEGAEASALSALLKRPVAKRK